SRLDEMKERIRIGRQFFFQLLALVIVNRFCCKKARNLFYGPYSFERFKFWHNTNLKIFTKLFLYRIAQFVRPVQFRFFPALLLCFRPNVEKAIIFRSSISERLVLVLL